MGLCHDLVQATTPDGTFVYTNPSWQTALEYSTEELASVSFFDLLVAADHPKYLSGIASLTAKTSTAVSSESLTSETITLLMRKKSGDWLRATGTLVQDLTPTGEAVVWFIGRPCSMLDDCGGPKTIERTFFDPQELAQVTLHSIGDGVITTDSQGRVEYLNPMAEFLTGWYLDAAKGRFLSAVFQVVDEATRTPLANPVEQVIRDACITNTIDYPLLIGRTGCEYCIDCSSAPIHNQDRKIIGAVIVFRDVTQARRQAQEMSWQATHDAMTGLVNRQQFEHDVLNALKEIYQSCSTHVLCYLDLDHFKVVNDTCGHCAGDELLRQISSEIKRKVRASDIVARLGGDEFGVLLENCSLRQAQHIADGLRESIYNFRFIWEDKIFQVGVSIGLVPLDDINHSLSDVLSAADAACYKAKGQGRNRIHVYHLSDAEVSEQSKVEEWSTRIKNALDQGDFCLYQQPIMSTLLGASVQHQEILLRMMDGPETPILPGAFLPAAKRYGLMPDIDRWVIQSVLAYRQQHPSVLNKRQQPRLFMINIASESIQDDDFCQWLQGELSRFPVLARQICFEISEMTATQDFRQVLAFVRMLKPLGCRVALDNFGTGVYCFKSLQEMPIDYLKIDGMFINQIALDPAAYAIVEAINHIAHTLGIETIAGAVGDVDVQIPLKQIGIDYIQGFGIAEPQPMKTLVPQNLAR